jgi:hypothetical protein
VVSEEGTWEMLNNSFKIGDSNTNLGTNSTILGGSGNFIAFGASFISLINCTGVVVEGNVTNFAAIGLSNTRIDSTYSNTIETIADKPKILRVTSDFTIDGNYDIYEVDLDSIGVPITCTWDAVAHPIQVVFKIVSNASGMAFTIDDITSPPSSPPQTIDGNSLPWISGLVTYDSITVYSNGTSLNII